MPARLLVIDDDRAILNTLRRHLPREGFHVVAAANAGEALSYLKTDRFDLILLDIGLPDVDGFTFCRRIRQGWHVPIVMLTARSGGADKIAGLEVGADDYVTKPFELPELVARLRAHLRRSGEYNAALQGVEPIQVGRLLIDPDRRELSVRGAPVSLTEKEFDLLWLLARHAGRALEREWMFEHVWGDDCESDSQMLAVYVRRLRKKIEEDPDAPKTLLTIRGYGYKLAAS